MTGTLTEDPFAPPAPDEQEWQDEQSDVMQMEEAPPVFDKQALEQQQREVSDRIFGDPKERDAMMELIQKPHEYTVSDVDEDGEQQFFAAQGDPEQPKYPSSGALGTAVEELEPRL